ncbi:MAG: RNA methyltransferase [Desulfobulbaceae bacterium]|jgi:hypothetical protein|nr:RNA methyltransferase [Desulfobulbaceae bacterium]
MREAKVDIALIHYPVYNKNHDVIGSAVTNLDLHDLARAGKTYGVRHVYVVTPFADQQKLVQEIVGHWQDGYGATYNPDRKEALAIIRICADVDELLELTKGENGEKPTVVATCATPKADTIPFGDAKTRILAGEQFLFLFGTAWGLTEEVFEVVDGTFPPIKGRTAYNHLSVRSAVSIILDRILGV